MSPSIKRFNSSKLTEIIFILEITFSGLRFPSINVAIFCAPFWNIIEELPEQQKIAAILSTIDEQISTTDKIIEKSKELKKGLMQKLFSEGIGHTEFKDTKIGRIPKDWEVVKIGDVTKIKEANELVKQSEEKYRGIIENLELGILEVDKNDKIIKAYPKFCSLSGYSEKELLGKSPTKLFLERKSRKIMQLQNKIRLKGIPGVYEVPLIKKNNDMGVFDNHNPFKNCYYSEKQSGN